MLINIQCLRFIAAFLVVLHHGAAHLRSAGQDLGWLFGFGETAGFAGVDIFFVISGFIMAWTTENAAGASDAMEFARRRVARIYSGYWPFYLLALVLFALLSPHFLSGVDFVGSALLWPTDLQHLLIPVSWTLIFEMGFYLIFTVIVAATNTRRAVVIGWLASAALGWSLFSGFMRGAYDPGRLEAMSLFEQYLAFPYLLEFLAGAILAGWLRTHQRGLALTYLLAGCVLFIAGGWLNVSQFDGKLIQGYHILWRILIFGSASVLLVAGMVRLENSNRSCAARLSILAGGSSYALYLSHTLILDAARRLGMREFLAQSPMWAAQAGMLLLCGLIVIYAILHYRLVEWPLHRAFRRWLGV